MFLLRAFSPAGSPKGAVGSAFLLPTGRNGCWCRPPGRGPRPPGPWRGSACSVHVEASGTACSPAGLAAHGGKTRVQGVWRPGRLPCSPRGLTGTVCPAGDVVGVGEPAHCALARRDPRASRSPRLCPEVSGASAAGRSRRSRPRKARGHGLAVPRETGRMPGLDGKPWSPEGPWSSPGVHTPLTQAGRRKPRTWVHW